MPTDKNTNPANQHVFLSYLDRCIPESVRADISERFKARSLVLMVSILVLVSAASLASVIAVDHSFNLRRFITAILIALQLLSLFILWRTKRTIEASSYVVGLLTMTITYIDFNNASFSGAFSIIWMLPPTLAVMLLGGKVALKVAVYCMFAMSINFYLFKQGLLPEPITPPAKWINVEYIISVTIMFLVTMFTFALSRMARYREEDLSAEIESRKQIANELEVAKNIAESAAANKAMFLATMSHELRTPLNTILGNAELMMRNPDEEKTESRVEDIYAAGQLLISIVNDVLDVSKFDSQGIELHLETYDLSEQIKRIHRMMSSRLKPGVSFKLEGTEEPLIVRADQNRLSQVLLNLVSNALKFTETGEVKVCLIKQQEGITINVVDTGVGISEEDAKNLFQEFVQVKKHANRQIEGTGLGLAIIQRIVNRMEGTITLSSEEGKGSTFSVYLPLDVLSQTLETDQDRSERDSNTIDLSVLKVLIVDDVAMNCIMLRALLDALGISDISEEHDGIDVLERVQEGNEYDVILMDVRMPMMDGLEASERIRQLGYTKPIIAVTANAFDEDKHACIQAGMDGFLSKPIELDKLQEVLVGVCVQ